MARIRTIKPEFFTSEDIVNLSPLARLLYIAIWCESDKEGRLVWKPMTFKLRYFPGDNCDIQAMCAEIVNAGLVKLYGEGLAVIPTFKAHQHINPRESVSQLPEPVAIATRQPRVTTRQPRDSDAQGGREGKGKEGKDSSRVASFDSFWSAYPKKVGKNAAVKAFENRNPSDELLAQMLAAIATQSRSQAWGKDDGQFIPHPATWLNQGRWMDEETGSTPTPNSKPGSPEYAKLHKDSAWWQDAGFSDVWDANSSMCWAHNAHQFADGKRVEVAA